MMSNPNQQGTTGRLRSAVEIMDEEFKTKGDHSGKIWTQAELDESRRLSDRHEALLAKGYSEEQIDALWAGKTPQEIIAGASENGTAPQAEKEEGNVDNLADKLTQALHKLQDDKIDAVINAFLALGSWDSIRPTPRGTKINDFVIWAHRAGKQEEAYQRAVNPR